MQRCALFCVLAVGTASGAYTPTWAAGTGTLAGCAQTTTSFNVPICASALAFAETTKLNHIANVFMELADNDADGVVDSAAVFDHMVANNYVLMVTKDSSDTALASWEASYTGTIQLTRIDEAVPNSCDVPTHRGATTARATWAAAIGNTPGATGCDPNRDATVEEILHLINTAASALYPGKWGVSFASTAGALIQTANGNCGWGYAGTYIDPSSAGCVGRYAYSDATCDEACIVIEGIYWAIVTYIGGLYTTARQAAVKNEWLMCTPDDGMTIARGASGSLETGSSALWLLVQDTTSAEGTWIPSIMPSGNYAGTTTPNASPSPSPSPSSGSGRASPALPAAGALGLVACAFLLRLL